MAVDDGNDYYRSTGIRFFDFFALFVTFFFCTPGSGTRARTRNLLCPRVPKRW